MRLQLAVEHGEALVNDGADGLAAHSASRRGG